MGFLKLGGILLSLLLLQGCQIGYILKSSYHQANLLWKRVPIEEALSDPRLPTEARRKLRLAIDAKSFAQSQLNLKSTKNYSSYVRLNDPYVTYAVSAASPYELKAHLWSFPFVGKVPYKGYFVKEDALEEEKDLQKEGLDTYVRGVAAYSTLGWFNDPLLSSMLKYDDYDLVNVIIHETVHATIYISSAADFNERLATYIGNKGTELFYRNREGENSPTLMRVRTDNADDEVFSKFISEEVAELEKWYKIEGNANPERKLARLSEIQLRFSQKVKPLLQGTNHSKFATLKLNNAILLAFKTYMNDLSDFEKLFVKVGSDFGKLLTFCKSLEKQDSPEKKLKEFIGG